MARPLRIEYDYGTVYFTCRSDEKNGILNTMETGRNFLSIRHKSVEKYKMELLGCDIGISHSVHPIKEEGASCGWR